MVDRTLEVFNQFYNTKLQINADQYEVVLSYFRGLTTNDRTAKAYAENLFRISNNLDIDVLTLLETFQTSDQMKVTLTMAYYLNALGDRTVMFGVNNVLQANQLAARNILQ